MRGTSFSCSLTPVVPVKEPAHPPGLAEGLSSSRGVEFIVYCLIITWDVFFFSLDKRAQSIFGRRECGAI